MSDLTFDPVARLAEGGLVQAIALLERPGQDAVAVHDLRVLMKRLRGLLRLYRGRVPFRIRTEMNGLLRDLARQFAAQRDAQVLLETLANLVERYRYPDAAWLQRIRADLQQKNATTVAAPALSAAVQTLRQVQTRWQTELRQADGDFCGEALVESYRRCRREGRVALQPLAIHRLHAWRKPVKYLGYQLAVVAVPGESLQQQGESLRRLGSLLGKVHDLDVLALYLHEQADVPARIHRHLLAQRTRLLKKIRVLFADAFPWRGRAYRQILDQAIKSSIIDRKNRAASPPVTTR